MAKEMTKEETEFYRNLENNFPKIVEDYEKEARERLGKGEQKQLAEELKSLEDYNELVSKGEVDDLDINIDLCRAKIQVLRSLLLKNSGHDPSISPVSCLGIARVCSKCGGAADVSEKDLSWYCIKCSSKDIKTVKVVPPPMFKEKEASGKCPACGKRMEAMMVCFKLESGGNAMKEEQVCKSCGKTKK